MVGDPSHVSVTSTERKEYSVNALACRHTYRNFWVSNFRKTRSQQLDIPFRILVCIFRWPFPVALGTNSTRRYKTQLHSLISISANTTKPLTEKFAGTGIRTHKRNLHTNTTTVPQRPACERTWPAQPSTAFSSAFSSDLVTWLKNVINTSARFST
jgi:hypothetical protein